MGECGEADDGCGGRVSCGACKPGQTCTDQGKCCQPVTIAKCGDAFPPGTCGRQPDGCGGWVACDTICGLNDGMLTCGSDGKCHCIDAATQAGYMQAAAACMLTQAHFPAYCQGNMAIRTDIPATCHNYGVEVIGVPYDLWCCESQP